MKCVVLGAWCLMIGIASLSVRAADEALPRNPFWPQGYEGERYPISLESRLKPEPENEEAPAVETNAVALAEQAAAAAKAEEEAKKQADPLENPIWNDAVKSLRFGSTMSFSANGKTQATLAINGRSYVAGDLVSTNFEENRFTWRIESLSTNGKIKLKRITYRKIGTNP